jgi:hypothetical protein
MTELMDLGEMAAWLTARARDGLFRFEGHRYYAAASDDHDYQRFLDGHAPAGDKSSWLKMLAQAQAERRRWSRLRVIHLDEDGQATEPYEIYSCHAYVDNVAAGEDVRIVEVQPGNTLDQHVEDFFIASGQHVVLTHYDDDHRHAGAEVVDGVTAHALIALRDVLWGQAVPFAQWWASRPELHRTLVRAA